MSNLSKKTESSGPKWSRHALVCRDYTSTLLAGEMPGFSCKARMLKEITNQIKKYRYTS